MGDQALQRHVIGRVNNETKARREGGGGTHLGWATLQERGGILPWSVLESGCYRRRHLFMVLQHGFDFLSLVSTDA